MKIKKIGHCCLLIKTGGVTMLTDPGAFTVEAHKDIENIDIILITHEHADHLHIESLKEIVVKNPGVKIITNTSVGKLINEESLVYETLEGRDSKKILGIVIEAYDAKHEEIFEEIGQVQNTGYFIAERLFYPGDSFCNPEKSIEVLALPVAGPWCKVPEAIRFALSLKPKKAFPVHDGLLHLDRIGGHHAIPAKVLSENSIEFIPMVAGDEVEL